MNRRARAYREINIKPKRGHRFVIVEGLYDEALLNALLHKIGLTNLHGLGFCVIYGIKQSQDYIIKDLAHNPYPIIAFRDIDLASSKLGFQECVRLIQKGKELKCKIKNRIIHVSSGATVEIITVGLIDDKDLHQIGIKRHSMEDYLLKLIIVDKAVAEWCALSLKDLKKFTLKRKADVTRSKAILATLAAKKRLEYDELIKTIIQIASVDNVVLVTEDLLKPFVTFAE